MKLGETIALVSWFVGGLLLAFIEVIALPSDPSYSTVLQLLPLAFLIGGLRFVVSQTQKLWASGTSDHMKSVLLIGWVALFGIDAGIAALNNIAIDVFQLQLPYYYQGISLGQKIIALAGIFILGIASGLTSRHQQPPTVRPSTHHLVDPWEKPLTNIGLVSALLGIVLALAQYWSTVVLAGFLLLLAGVLLYPIGKLTEKDYSFDEEGN